MPQPWWRVWRYLVPVCGFAAVAAGALLWLRQPEPAVTAPPMPEPASPAPAMVWLDGEALELGNIDPEALFDDDVAEQSDVLVIQDALATDGLAPSNLGWVDQLDDPAIDRARQWLQEHPL
jgi:hypothetical protein